MERAHQDKVKWSRYTPCRRLGRFLLLGKNLRYQFYRGLYTPEVQDELSEQSNRKWKFSVTMCGNLSTGYERRWPECYIRTPCQHGPTAQLFSEHRKLILSFRVTTCMSGYTPQSSEVIARRLGDSQPVWALRRRKKSILPGKEATLCSQYCGHCTK
jgi:hypothetical protein